MRGKTAASILTAIVLVFSTFSIAQPANSDETCTGWPMFGKTPDGCHYVNGECAPKTCDYKLKWVYDTGETQLLRKLLLVGNRVIAYGYSGKLYSLVANSSDPKGTFVWTYDLASQIKTPCTDGTRMYIGLESGMVQCVDMKSKVKVWQTSIPESNIDSHPMVYRDRLYINTVVIKRYGAVGSFFMCVNSRTGKTIWKTEGLGRIFGAPAFLGDRMVVATDEGELCCFDISKDTSANNLVWRKKLGGRAYSPAVRNGRVYAFAVIKSDDFTFYCFNLADGNELWRYDAKKRAELYDYVTVNDKFLVSDCNKGVSCFDTSTGNVVWSKPDLGFSTTMTDKYVFSVDNKKVMCSSLENGELLWSSPVDGPTGPVVIDRDLIFLRGGSKVYCFKLATPGYPELEDSDTDIDPGTGVIAPSKIVVNPQVLTVEPGKSQKFEAVVLDAEGKALNVNSLIWQVEGSIGTIDSEGVFTASKQGECDIRCSCGEISATAHVYVIKYLKVSPEQLEFKSISVGTNQTGTVKFTCSPYKNLNVKLTCSSQQIQVSPSSFSLKAGQSAEVKVTVASETLEPGATQTWNITADYGEGILELPVNVSVSNEIPVCFLVSPKMLDFGFVDRGKSGTQKFVLTSTRKTSFVLKPMNNWLELSQTGLDLDAGQSVEISATIVASSLPTGQSFTSSIEINESNARCKMVSIPVFIETDKGVALELTIDSPIAYLNGKPIALDSPPAIISGRTMVPIRFISESFGCKVEWNAKESKITIIRHDMTIRLWKGKTIAKVNDEEKILDSPPQILKGRTFVPLRFISEPFGAKVSWDKATRKITIVWDPT